MNACMRLETLAMAAAYRGLPSGYDRYVGDIGRRSSGRVAFERSCDGPLPQHVTIPFLNLGHEDEIDPVV